MRLLTVKAGDNDFQELAMEKARVKFTSGITRVTGVSGFLLEVIWTIKWRMPLKCDFTTNSHLCRQGALFS